MKSVWWDGRMAMRKKRGERQIWAATCMGAAKRANCIADDSERRAIGLLHGSNLSTSIVCHTLWCDGIFVWSTNTKAS
jgi:hypothetical protein